MTDRTYTLVPSGVLDVTLSTDGKSLFTSTSNGHVVVYDMASHRIVHDWNLHGTLGAISLSDGGAYLLGVKDFEDHHRSLLYRLDTATGEVTYFSQAGTDFQDIQVVNSHEAIASGGNPDTLTRLDFAAGTFSAIAGGVDYSTDADFSRSGRFSLVGEKGIENGPLAVYDGARDRIVATGDDYQPGATLGFNWGAQAISQGARLVAQAVAQETINIYDLGLHVQRTFQIEGVLGGVASGLAFDRSGKDLFVLDGGNTLHEYRTSDWSEIRTLQLPDMGASYYEESYADTLLVGPGGRHLTVFGNDTGTVTLIDLTEHHAALSPSTFDSVRAGAFPRGMEASAAIGGDHMGPGPAHLIHPFV